MEDSVISEGGVRWLHQASAADGPVTELGIAFGFHPFDLRDVRPPLQRPKIVSREGYLFMILLFPYYQEQSREIRLTEIDFFIGPDYLVTVNDKNEFAPLARAFETIRSDEKKRRAVFSGGVGGILIWLLGELHQTAFPMLVHISQDIDHLENRLFDTRARGTVEEILRIKTNIVDFRRAMQGHKPVIERLLAVGNGNLDIKRHQPAWYDLIDNTKEIWVFLEAQRETITAIYETHTALLSHRLNEVMKRLTLVSVILLPLTLLSSLFGMNYDDIPFSGSAHGFWVVVLLLAVTLFGVVGYFRSRDWI